MNAIQLNPTVPMVTARGPGFAFIMINPSDDHHVQWVVGLDNGEIWTFQNPEVRLQTNITMGRTSDKMTPLNRKLNTPSDLAAKHDPYLEGILDRYNGKTPASFEDEYMAGYKAGKVGK